MKKTDFYREISVNRWKTVFLIVIFFIMIVGIGAAFGIFLVENLYFGMIFAFLIGFIYTLIIWNSGDSLILKTNKAKEITKQDDPFLYNSVEGLSIAAGIPMPKVYIMKEDSINAFATGKDPKKASVCVTTGAREKLNRQELEGVLAHEISHIKNYDIRVMMLAAVLVGVIILISDVMLRSMIFSGGRRSSSRNSGGGQGIGLLIALVLAILAPIVAQFIKMAISRKREYLADASGAMLTRYPPGLAGALKKIKGDTNTVVDHANKAMAHLYIENPLRHTKRKQVFAGLFSTHPPIDQRITKLEAM